jgi:hypothetical protein
MKTKLTVTIDEELLPIAKGYAKSNGISLSQLIESALRLLTSEDKSTFSERWDGAFQVAEGKDERYEALVKKYL